MSSAEDTWWTHSRRYGMGEPGDAVVPLEEQGASLLETGPAGVRPAGRAKRFTAVDFPGVLSSFLARGGRTPAPTPAGRALRLGEVASGSPPVDPEILASCWIALRRMGEDNLGSIAVTSTTSGEGRTTVALGLAATASGELRRKTVLLDLDFKVPDDQMALAPGPGPAAAEFLYEVASIEDCLRPAGPNFEIIEAGTLLDPADLPSRIDRVQLLISGLRERCDVLVADLPPLDSSITTARIADLFDSVTLVVRTGGVELPVIAQTASRLGRKPFVVLNEVAPGRPSRSGKPPGGGSSFVSRLLGRS